MDNLLKRELLQEIQRCVELFNSRIFTSHSLFTQSAFIELLIRLDYVLQGLSKKGKRLTWTDAVQTENKIKDVTDLVNYLRNAACHIDSRNNYVGNSRIKFVFNTVVGKSLGVIQIGQKQILGNEYNDDIAFYYGDKRIYLIRHIKRLLEELPNKIGEFK